MAGNITYFAYDMGLPSYTPVPVLLAELPFTGVTWSQRLNTPGSFSGSILINDPRIGPLAVSATTPAKTWLFVDMDGVIVWGGIIQTRSYDNQSNQLQIGANEAWAYYQQRAQAQDYNTAPLQDASQPSKSGATFWTSNTEYYAQDTAAQIISDAAGPTGLGGFNALGGIPITNFYRNPTDTLDGGGVTRWVNQYVTVSESYILVSFPKEQLQTVDGIITSLAQSGYGIGFDWAIDWFWSNGTGSTPIPTCNIHYPLRGRPVSVTGFAIDTALAVPYSWPEDATQMADAVFGVASGSGGMYASQVQESTLSQGYPFLEAINTYANVNTPQQLTACINDDLNIAQLPVPTPTYTVPLYGEETIAFNEVMMGDDVTIYHTPDPRFPGNGSTWNYRITGTDVTVADEGLSTVMYTCTIPPGLVGGTTPGSGGGGGPNPTGGTGGTGGPSGGPGSPPIFGLPTTTDLTPIGWVRFVQSGADAPWSNGTVTLAQTEAGYGKSASLKGGYISDTIVFPKNTVSLCFVALAAGGGTPASTYAQPADSFFRLTLPTNGDNEMYLYLPGGWTDPTDAPPDWLSVSVAGEFTVSLGDTSDFETKVHYDTFNGFLLGPASGVQNVSLSIAIITFGAPD